MSTTTTENSVETVVEAMPLFPPRSVQSRLAHFDDTVYRPSGDTLIYKLVDALCGDGGAADLKKEILISRLAQQLETIYFQDLDRLFENAFHLSRLSGESYSYDPSSDLLTSEEWDEIRIKDAWYRSRAKDYMMALQLGPTPEGMRMAVHSAVGEDCEILEVWKYIDNYGFSSLSQHNLLVNGDFEPALTSWTSNYNDVAVGHRYKNLGPNGVYSGTNAMRVHKKLNGSDGVMRVWTDATSHLSPSLLYTVSAALKSPKLKSLNLVLEWYNTAGLLIRTDLKTVAINSYTYTLHSNTVTAPAGTYRVRVMITSVGSPDVGSEFYVDGVGLSEGSTPFDYKVDSNTRLGRIGVNLRNEIVLAPHVPELTEKQRHQVYKTVNRIKPVDKIITVDTQGLEVTRTIPILGAGADSSYFEIVKNVTGVPDLKKLPKQQIVAQDVIQSELWLESSQTKKAPHGAFNSTQESSLWYVYSSRGTQIDNAKYEREDFETGKKVRETNYATQNVSTTSWGPWTPFVKVDSPDNYPGGKNGLHPEKSPALKLDGTPYVFEFESQASYMAMMTTLVREQNGQISGNRYRKPLKTTKVSTRTFLPIEAVPTKAPTKDSTVTTGWIPQSPTISVARSYD